MTPEERQILTGLFDRIRANSGGQRDPQAENFIAEAVRAQPYAPYLLAQNVIVMEQTLQAASQRIQELEGQVAAQGQGGGSFLGNATRSIFGGAAPMQGAAPQQRGYAPPPPQGGPWGQQPPQQYQPQAGGGGFLKGALGAAAGVAGGVLLADSLRGLFGGHSGGLGSMFGGAPGGAGETTVNNYYDSGAGTQDAFASGDPRGDLASGQDQTFDVADDSGGDGGGDSGTYDA